MKLKLTLVRETNPPYHVGQPIMSPAEAARLLGPIIADEPQEVFMVAVCDARHRYRGHYEVSRGSATTSIVHPREVFAAALMRNASALFLFHNHPSGDPKPSDEDVAVTRRLVHAAELLGLRILDHVIVGHAGNYCSFKETGLL